MGTRALTVFEEDKKEIVVMYRQMDGYPEGHGQELKEFLAKRPIVNGIGKDCANAFNGMGCLSASVIAHFKEGIGGFYLYPAGTRDVGEEYIYTVSGKAGDKEAKIKTEEV